MKIKLSSYLILLSLFALPLQNKAQQVINSAGADHQIGNSNIYITDNIGEPFITTYGPAAGLMITQGFLQPFMEAPAGFTVNAAINHLPCKDKFEDGFIDLSIVSSISS